MSSTLSRVFWMISGALCSASCDVYTSPFATRDTAPAKSALCLFQSHPSLLTLVITSRIKAITLPPVVTVTTIILLSHLPEIATYFESAA
eukprot:CAMPEP_0169482758 /NCGR_PEP_ID=MMETSP1042-20121227/30860_1 /TAXON_ID=464988 /ORGANISM="Hemiselmis andersenii, Strain CCMP1180" /LENGTH=89 /DNA_ID=CAMNT_0009597675 /DNA_START=452 /DNA_END=718 /DNA_ORIENTATION=-